MTRAAVWWNQAISLQHQDICFITWFSFTTFSIWQSAFLVPFSGGCYITGCWRWTGAACAFSSVMAAHESLFSNYAPCVPDSARCAEEPRWSRLRRTAERSRSERSEGLLFLFHWQGLCPRSDVESLNLLGWTSVSIPWQSEKLHTNPAVLTLFWLPVCSCIAAAEPSRSPLKPGWSVRDSLAPKVTEVLHTNAIDAVFSDQHPLKRSSIIDFTRALKTWFVRTIAMLNLLFTKI